MFINTTEPSFVFTHEVEVDGVMVVPDSKRYYAQRRWYGRLDFPGNSSVFIPYDMLQHT